jgi:hypothetical protein
MIRGAKGEGAFDATTGSSSFINRRRYFCNNRPEIPLFYPVDHQLTVRG